MQKLLMTFAIAAVLVVPLGSAPAQQPQGQSMPGMPATGQAVDATQLAACVQSQRDATMLIEAAEARLEAARQANEPAAMRSAVDDLQATLSRVRSRLTSCAQLAASAPGADPHAGHTMTSPAPPGTPVMTPGSPAPAAPAPKPPAAADPHAGHVMPPAPPAGATPAPPSRTTKPASPPAKAPAAADPHAGHAMAPTPPMDHSKMQMGKPPAAKKPASAGKAPTPPPMDHSKMPMGSTPAAKSSSPAGAKPAPPAAPTDHSKMAMGAPADPAATATDPVCGLKIDPTTAPKATHQGETYYFCSERHQQLFTKTPAKYLPKRK